MAGGKVAGLLLGQQEDADLRRKLRFFADSDDPGVESEAHQQLARIFHSFCVF